MKEISAGIIIYRKTQKGPRFLLVYHGNNYWNFPKGKIEKESRAQADVLTRNRENSWQAAVREIREETGLKLNDLKFRRQFKTFDKYIFYRAKERVFKIVILYLAETNKSEIKLSDEHEGYGWFTYREALRVLSKYKDSQRILSQAYNFIRRPQTGAKPLLLSQK